MIRFEQVHKWFGDHHVLAGVDLHVREGMLFVLCGESGAGKSTLLATVNGLEPVASGAIHVAGVAVGRARDLRPLRCQVGVVFQGYNLFPHLTVEQNMRLGLEKGLLLERKESIRRVHQYLEQLGLRTKAHAYPAELSGGQQQRVAIARCLAMRTRIVLMDEPTSALDIDNALEVVATIRSLKHEGMTILIATHQIAMFADIADEMACMEAGRITERGTLGELRASGTQCSRLASWLSRSPNSKRPPPSREVVALG